MTRLIRSSAVRDSLAFEQERSVPPRALRACSAAALLLACVAPGAVADEPASREPAARELVTVGEQRALAELVKLSDASIEFRVDEQPKPVPLDGLVRWGEPAERPAQPTALLSDRSVIVCGPGWARGGAVQLTDDRWLLRNPKLNGLQLARSDVRAVWFAAAASDPRTARTRSESAGYRGQEDRVWLTSGDVLSGRLSRIDKGLVAFNTAGEEIEIELARVGAVAIADTGGANIGGGDRGALVAGLRDGSLLNVLHVEQLANRTKVRLGVGEELAAKADLGVVFLRAGGGRVLRLSTVEPLDYQHTPYLSVDWSLGRGAVGPGELFRAGGQRRLDALAMHSASRVVYRTEGDWRRFAADLAVEDSGAEGSVTFHVLVARQAGFEAAYDSPIIRSGDPPTPISIDVEGARAIALLIDFADYADRGDHAVWLDARLER